MATAWTAPTLVNLRTYIQNAVLNVANTKDLTSGQADRFTQAMKDVTNEMRARMQSIPGTVISATVNSVPPSLMNAACMLILVAMQSSYPALGLSKDQITEFNKAWELLDEIRDGTLAIEIPIDPQTVDVQLRNAPVTIVRSTCRTITAESMKGI